MHSQTKQVIAKKSLGAFRRAQDCSIWVCAPPCGSLGKLGEEKGILWFFLKKRDVQVIQRREKSLFSFGGSIYVKGVHFPSLGVCGGVNFH